MVVAQTTERTWESWNSFKFNFFMMLNRSVFVVANSQQRPELFWFVIGDVEKSSSVLNTSGSAIFASRATSTSRRFVCASTVRARRTFGSADATLSHWSTWPSVSAPSGASGPCVGARESAERRSCVNASFSSSRASTAAVAGLEGVFPMAFRSFREVSGDRWRRTRRRPPYMHGSGFPIRRTMHDTRPVTPCPAGRPASAATGTLPAATTAAVALTIGFSSGAYCMMHMVYCYQRAWNLRYPTSALIGLLPRRMQKIQTRQ